MLPDVRERLLDDPEGDEVEARPELGRRALLDELHGDAGRADATGLLLAGERPARVQPRAA